MRDLFTHWTALLRARLIVLRCRYNGCDWSGWVGYRTNVVLLAHGYAEQETGEVQHCLECWTVLYRNVEWTRRPLFAERSEAE